MVFRIGRHLPKALSRSRARLDREQKDNEERLAKKASAKLLAINADTPISEADKKEQERKRTIIAAAIARAQQKK